MEGSSVSKGKGITMPPSTTSNLVLVGRTGNGKSATGNTILGKRIFESKSRPSSVTKTCELKSAVLQNGNTVNVVDTPGLFDTVTSQRLIGKEIVRCVELCKDGIHAVLIVISATNRFTKEEADAYRNLERLFGPSIFNYMIVIVTGGDTLEEDGDTLEKYLEYSSDSLKDLLKLCNGRVVLFNNKTHNDHIKHHQLQQLLNLTDAVLSENCGQPYTDEMFNKIKDARLTLESDNEMIESLKGYSEEYILQMKEEMALSHKSQLERMTRMVEERLMATTSKLEEQLGQEQAARKEAELLAKKAQMNYDEKIQQFRESLEEARRNDQAAQQSFRESLEEARRNDQTAQQAFKESLEEARQRDQAALKQAQQGEHLAKETTKGLVEEMKKSRETLEEERRMDQAARKEAELIAKKAHMEYDEKIRQLTKNFEEERRKDQAAQQESMKKYVQEIRMSREYTEEARLREDKARLATMLQLATTLAPLLLEKVLSRVECSIQ